MAKRTNYEIKTTLAVDGEKEFKAAMDDANRSMRVWDADLRAVQAEFKATGDQERYLADKTELLASKVKQQEAVVEALNRAVKEAADKYGDASKKTDDYRIKLSNATAKMFDLRRESEQANKELEELGKDSGKIGRQIKDGIGDAAEDTKEKLDGMFDQVAKDVNALKSSVAFQMTTDVGGAVFEAIQGAMNFVNENREFNLKLAQTRSVVEMYGYNADKIIQIAKDATAAGVDFETAQEALVNLAAAGFENEEQIAATAKSLLGIWLSSAGTLDFSGLAEDYLESVKEKTPTGTYAEAIIKFTDQSVEDVKKVMEKMKSHADVLEFATAIMTEAGLQTKVDDYVEKNKELVEAQTKTTELALAWAGLAERIQPITNEVLGGTITIVEGLNKTLDELEKFTKNAKKQIETGTTGQEILQNVKINPSDLTPDFINKMVDRRKEFGDWFYSYKDWTEQLSEKIVNWMIPSAGAETLPTAELQNYGFTAAQEIANGMLMASEGETAASAAVKTMISTMSAETIMADAQTSGKNLMINFGNGIAEGMSAPLENVRTMVNQINAMLSQIATPAYGLGYSGISGGNIYLYNNRKNAASALSKTIGAGVSTMILKD